MIGPRAKNTPNSMVAAERVIHVIRGQRVMLDKDLAEIYGVTTKRLNEQVRRNPNRFPDDFMLQLTEAEFDSLRSQNATLKTARGQHRKYLPYAFTEHGAVMLASVLNSPQAVEASIFIARAFIRLRELTLTHKSITDKLAELERRVSSHDESIRSIVTAIRQLMTPPPSKTKRIGYKRED